MLKFHIFLKILSYDFCQTFYMSLTAVVNFVLIFLCLSSGMRQMRSHMLAQEGYYVVSIDSRGSSNRGLAFESHLRLRMGQVELQDQVEVLRWLGSMTESMDMDRVAIYGWSYGGYLSLMGLVTYPELFKVCVAGAPVTSWANYDTGYTERYMGLPANNSWSYNLGSIVSRASDFPDE